jgi:protein gp37
MLRELRLKARCAPAASAVSKVAKASLSLRRARSAFFFKQWGGVRKKSTGRHYCGRTFDEMPRAVAMS